MRTRLKNRIHSVLDKYGLQDEVPKVRALFVPGVRESLQGCLGQLPPQAAYTSGLLLKQLDRAQATIVRLEKRMAKVFRPTQEVQLLDTLPGVGRILSVVMALEIGDIRRFACAERLASYAGTVPRVHSSGGKTLSPDIVTLRLRTPGQPDISDKDAALGTALDLGTEVLQRVLEQTRKDVLPPK